MGITVRELITKLGFQIDETGVRNYEKTVQSLINFAKGAAVAAVGAGTAFIKLAGDSEQTKVAFETMLGSAEAAAGMISALRKEAMITPYSEEALIQGSKLFLNFGMSAQDVIPTMRMVSEIASGDENKLHALSLALAQASSAGRLMGQDLLQMINAGFNPLQEISRTTGVSLAVLKKRMEAGQISIEMVTDAFKTATSAGGRFYEMNKKQSQTFMGRLSTFLDYLRNIGREIGEALLPIAGEALEEFSAWLEVNKEWIKQDLASFFKDLFLIIKDLVKILLQVLPVAMKVLKFIWDMKEVILPLIVGLKAWALVQGILNTVMSANPLGAIVTGILILVGVIWWAVKNWEKVKKFFVGLWDGIKRGVTNGAKALWDFAKSPIGKALMAVFAPMFQLPTLIAQNWQGVTSFFAGIWKSIADGAAGVWNTITAGFRAAFDFIISLWDKVSGIWKGAMDFVGGVAKALGIKVAAPVESTVPKYAKGTNYVPEDQLAWLHKGEQVIPRGMTRGGTVNKSLNVQATVNVAVPAGTSTEQVTFLRSAVKAAVNEEWQAILREASVQFVGVG
jgi:tape measure domain-containing protein